MKTWIRPALLCLGMLSASQADASLLEVRGAFNLLQADPSAINDYNGAGFPKLGDFKGFGGDVIAMLPAVPVGLGLRYEKFSADGSTGGNRFDADFERTSVVVNKRFIDTGLYFGPIFTVGVTNQFTLETQSGTVKSRYKASSGVTLSAGLEAGLNLIIVKLGAEAGYLYAPLGNLKFSNGTDATDALGNTVKTDMSGPYARAVLGFGF